MRTLYRCLLWLHPADFRTAFAGEMLWIYDQARHQQGAWDLFYDAGISLMRQRLFRSTYWKIPAAFTIAFLQLSMVMGWLASSHPHIAQRIAFDQFRGGWTGEASLEGTPVPLQIDFIPHEQAWDAEASLGGVPLKVERILVEPGRVRFQLESGETVLQFEGKRASRGGRVSGIANGAQHGTFTLLRD